MDAELSAPEPAISRVPIEIWTQIIATATLNQLDTGSSRFVGLPSTWVNCRLVNRMLKRATEEAFILTHLRAGDRAGGRAVGRATAVILRCEPRSVWETIGLCCPTPLLHHTQPVARRTFEFQFDRVEDELVTIQPTYDTVESSPEELQVVVLPRARVFLKPLSDTSSPYAHLLKDEHIWQLLDPFGFVDKYFPCAHACGCAMKPSDRLSENHSLIVNWEVWKDIDMVGLRLDHDRREVSFLWIQTFEAMQRIQDRNFKEEQAARQVEEARQEALLESRKKRRQRKLRAQTKPRWRY